MIRLISYGALIYLGIGVTAAAGLAVHWLVQRYQEKLLVHEVESVLRYVSVKEAA